MDRIIEVDRLSVVYRDTTAVDGISFHVDRGEVFGLLGTNGAGKTTTLDVLEGYRAPSAGTVRVMGCDPRRDHDQLAPRVGILLQEAAFFETLTVAQTVTAWRRFHVEPQPLERVLEAVGLSSRAHVRCSQLSGGERRRLDLALALLGGPELLYLDEPTTGMDPEARQECLDLVRRLVEDGTTVVLTTHYLEEAEVLADRVAIMNDGRIEATGTLSEMRRLAGDSRITFGIDPSWVDALPVREAVTVQRHPDTARVTICAGDPQRVLRELSDWAAVTDVRLDELTVQPGGLAEVFRRIAENASQRSVA
ncbi:ATP-binding cassette domain-containing protein [Kineococcus sp. R8]|uniref:ABC transporter ATP-binding protein n=1 Tax=Kineococcus siccus TaxID=2696567 RepID=UPI0014125F90|nr:ABC transporter ATP-binding protein [Kineococcus siccus]NAZ82994.1 ATP-binding cassette domain-containing protein [Kineococcus siccus]